jgi:hypothetical protein
VGKNFWGLDSAGMLVKEGGRRKKGFGDCWWRGKEKGFLADLPCKGLADKGADFLLEGELG